jgi:hypothetical protein
LILFVAPHLFPLLWEKDSDTRMVRDILVLLQVI